MNHQARLMIRRKLDQVISSARQQGADPEWLDFIFTPLSKAAGQEGGPDFATLLQDISHQVEQAGRLQSLLRGMQDELTRMDTNLVRQEHYTDSGEQTVMQQLADAFASNPEAGLDLWLRYVAEGIVDRQFSYCLHLALAPLGFPAHQPPYLPFFQAGIRALLPDSSSFPDEPDPAAALGFLVYLVDNGLGRAGLESAALDRALLAIQVGRIYLNQLDNAAAARVYFELAHNLALKDGRPVAALGDLCRKDSDYTQAESLYQQAIQLSPDQPDGYAGLGQLAEVRQLWGQVDEWFLKAFDAPERGALSEQDIVRLLGRDSGNLAFRLASRLVTAGDWSGALRAAERALALKVNSQITFSPFEKPAGIFPNKIESTSPEVPSPEVPSPEVPSPPPALEASVKIDYPQAPVNQLKGDILLGINKTEEAKQAYFEAGKEYYWNSQFDRAVEMFHKADNLPGTRMAGPLWYLSDSLYITSYIKIAPFINPGILTEALERWKEAAALEPPEILVWPLVTHAMILKAWDRIVEDRVQYWWESLVYLERAVFIRSRADDWYNMAYLFRCLNLNWLSLQANDQALALDTQNSDALEEKAAAFANLGRYDQSLKTIEQALALNEKSVWAHYIRAFCLAYLKRYDQAILEVKIALDADPDNVSYLSTYAFAAYESGQYDLAKVIYGAILKKYPGDTGMEYLLNYAEAAFYMEFFVPQQGHIELSLELTRRAMQDPSQLLADVYQQLGISSLVARQVLDGKQALRTMVEKSTGPASLLGFLNRSLPEVKRRLAGTPEALDLEPFFEELEGKINQKLKDLTPPTPLQAISSQVEAMQKDGGASVWGWVGANTSLARLQSDAEDWTGALSTLRRLLPHRSILPDLPDRAVKILERAQQAAQKCLYENYAGGVELCTSALEFIRDPERNWPDAAQPLANPALSETVWLFYLGIAKMATDVNASLEDWRSGLEAARRAGDPHPGLTAAGALDDFVVSLADFWALDTIISNAISIINYQQDPFLNDWESIRAALAPSLLSLMKASGPFQPAAGKNRIDLDLGASLLPTSDTKDWPLLINYLPQMRVKIQEEMGVLLPGLLVRDGQSTLPPTGYSIWLDGVQIATGKVETGFIYVPLPPESLAPLGLPSTAIIKAPHPVTGVGGWWVKSEAATLLDKQGLPYWQDPFNYVVAHLKGVLIRSLDRFVDSAAVQKILTGWRKQPGAAASIDWLLPDGNARLRLGKVLRSLLAEGLPVTDWKAILEGLMQAGLSSDDIQVTAEVVRRRLQPILPGNRPGARRLPLSSEFEDALAGCLQRQGKRTFLTLSSDAFLPVRTQINRLVSAAPPGEGPLVLVTRHPELRPHLRLLVALDHPEIQVMSAAELLETEPARTPYAPA